MDAAVKGEKSVGIGGFKCRKNREKGGEIVMDVTGFFGLGVWLGNDKTMECLLIFFIYIKITLSYKKTLANVVI